mgnify:FL=1
MSKRNPLDEALSDLMDAWMELVTYKPFQGANFDDIAKQVPDFVRPKQHIGDWEDRNGEIAVTIDMPGIVKEDIELNVDTNKVSVIAKTEDRDYSFNKEFKALGYTLNPEEVSAEFNNGVLDVKIQKSVDETSKRIDIK